MPRRRAATYFSHLKTLLHLESTLYNCAARRCYGLGQSLLGLGGENMFSPPPSSLKWVVVPQDPIAMLLDGCCSITLLDGAAAEVVAEGRRY
jgi:hypothetical protein